MGTAKLAVVIPIYNEEETLPELRRRIREVCDQLEELDWQVVYVNDGSSDSSLEIINNQNAEDPRFTLVNLSRNFGHQAAITAGIAHVDADALIIMDGDLQDPPEVIPDLVACWREGAEVVIAQRTRREERRLRRIGFDLFYKFFGWISDFPIPANAGVFGLLDRTALEAFKKLPERNRYIPGLRSWIGFDQRFVLYSREERAAGTPKVSFRLHVRYALDAIFGFSYKPLRVMTIVGILLCILSAFLGLFFVFKRVLGIETAQTGFTTLVSLILFLGGFHLVSIGLLGEYLVRIYDEVKHRPLYLVKELRGVPPLGNSRSNNDTEIPEVKP